MPASKSIPVLAGIVLLELYCTRECVLSSGLLIVVQKTEHNTITKTGGNTDFEEEIINESCNLNPGRRILQLFS